MVNLIPELELVIGPQPPVPELPPQQAQYRFQHGVPAASSGSSPRPRASAGALPRRPAVGWTRRRWPCSPILATHPDVHHLLLVGAYRDNEVDSSHPLMRSLEAIRKEGGIVHDVVLTPLSQTMSGDSSPTRFMISPRGSGRFPSCVFEKTHGNPFFTIQFLTALAEEKLLGFDPEHAGVSVGSAAHPRQGLYG